MFRARPYLFVVLTIFAACRAHPVTVPEPAVTPPDPDVTPISVRGDTSWRQAARVDVHPAVGGPHADDASPLAITTPPVVAHADTTTRTRPARTSFRAITPSSLDDEPLAEELAADEGPAVLRSQILLDHANFSVGVLDGKAGQNLQKAVYFFQQEHGLPTTGRLDSATYARLVEIDGDIPGARQITVDDQLLRGPYVDIPSSVYEQAKLPCMCYVTVLEALDERYHTTPEVLRQLNPGKRLLHLSVGESLWVPNVEAFDPQSPQAERPGKRIVKIHVSKEGEYVHALAADGSIVYHFPTTVGSEYNPSPSGTYDVVDVEWHPPYRYDPTLLKDGDTGRGDALLPPGPNSPVGIVWIALSREHVGIHGTPRPDLIGLTSSHGCVRLTNWDAAKLAKSVSKGVTVQFLEQ